MTSLALLAFSTPATATTAMTIGGLSSGASSLLMSAAVMLDSALIIPRLFPPESPTAPKLDGLQLQSAEEGSPWSWCVGPSCRTSGNVLWLSRLIDEKDTSAGGGKGGSAGDFVQYKYFSHVAVGICDVDGVPIKRVLKIWADGKVVYDDAPDVSLGPTSMSITTSQTVTFGAANNYINYNTIRALTANADLSKLKSGGNVQVSGFASSVNNGIFKVTKSWKDDDPAGYSYVKVIVSVNSVVPGVSGVAEGTTSGTVYQKLAKFSLKHMASAPTFYYGDQDQPVDPIISAYETSPPAFRGRAYVVFEKFALFDWGNRLPNFEFMVEADDDLTTVGDAIAKILDRAGLDASEYDVSGLDDAFDGYTVRGQVSVTEQLQPILLAYDLLARQVDGKYLFYKRVDAPIIDIDDAHLAPSEMGSQPSFRLISVEQPDEQEVPSEVTVIYRDVDKNLNSGAQSERCAPVEVYAPQKIDLSALALSSSQAREIASRALWTSKQNRMRVSFETTPRYLASLAESCVARFSCDGEDWSVLLSQVDRGANMMISASGVQEDPRTLVGTTDADAPEAFSADDGDTGNQNFSNLPGYISLDVLDLPALRDEHTTKPGFYFVVCSPDDRARFTAAALYESQDGSRWSIVERVYEAAVVGTVTVATNSTAYPGVWDTVNEYEIELDYTPPDGAMESVSRRDVLNGYNWALIGDEVVAFTTVENLGDNVYRISEMQRGERNTESSIGTRAIGDRFVLLTGLGVHFHEVPLSALGTTRYYKAVGPGQRLEDVEAREVIVNARTLKQFGPSQVSGSRDVSNNLTITWTRRSNRLVGVMSGYTPPVGERVEQYDVEIMDSGGTTVLRTFSGITSLSRSYTAVQQTADGYTPGDPIVVRVYQVGEIIGRGNYTQETV